MAKKRLIRADAKWNDCPRLRKMPVHSIDDAGPGLVEAVVENKDAAFGQCALAGGKVMRGNVSRMATIDADHAQRASTKPAQVGGGELR